MSDLPPSSAEQAVQPSPQVPAAVKAPQPQPAVYAASIYPEPPQTVPAAFGAMVEALEEKIGMQVWLLIQANQDKDFSSLETKVVEAFLKSRDKLPDKPVALLLDSPGGQAEAAYQIATILRRHCTGFVAIIPRYAKSAATLLALGANKIILGKYAELGPLDAQLFDTEREESVSALDEAQALERLQAQSLEIIDQTIMHLRLRSGKKIDTLLPQVLEYASKLMRPLFEKIDVVHYNQVSRVLKIAEEYAIRLLIRRYGERARHIARVLVGSYPEHGFVIDSEEAARIGLKTEEAPNAYTAIVEALRDSVEGLTIVGRLQKVNLK